MSTKGKVVKGITQEQRYYLCLKKEECPNMKQSELAEWFKQKYNRGISQPTISHTLKQKDDLLQRGLNSPGMSAAKIRNRSVKHPQFERALYQWYISLGKVESEALTGPMLIEKAKQLAAEMQLLEPQVFCNGWLSRFRERYNIKHGRRRDDGGGGGNVRPHLINVSNSFASSSPSPSATSPSSSVQPAPADGALTTAAIAVRSTATLDASLSSQSHGQEDDDAGSRVKRQKTTRHSSQQPDVPRPQDATPPSETLDDSSRPYHLAFSAVATTAAAAAAASREALEAVSEAETTEAGRSSQLQCENQLHMELLRSLPLDPSPVHDSQEGGEGDGASHRAATASTLAAATDTSTTTTTTSWPHTAPLHDDSILAQIAAHTHGTGHSSPTPAITTSTATIAATTMVMNGGATSVSAATLSEASTDPTVDAGISRVSEAKEAKPGVISPEEARACLDTIRVFVNQKREVSSWPMSSGGGGELLTRPTFYPEKAYELLMELQQVLDV